MKLSPCVLLAVTLFVSASVNFTCAVRQEIRMDVLMRALENMYVQRVEASKQEPTPVEGQEEETENQEAEAEEEQEVEEYEQEQSDLSRLPYMHNLMGWLEFEMFLQKIPKTTGVFAKMCEELLGWLENGYLRQWLVNHVSKREERVSYHFMASLMGRQDEDGSTRGEPREREDMARWQALIRSCSAYYRNGDDEEETEQERNQEPTEH